jgi:hypothetical protein
MKCDDRRGCGGLMHRGVFGGNFGQLENS